MDRIYDNCCGIDVHKKLIVACFRCGKKQDVREFGATTRELLSLADWLKEGGCEMVAMESTASYWKPLYNILESSDLNAMVVNARHMKAVPGRKTDVHETGGKASFPGNPGRDWHRQYQCPGHHFCHWYGYGAFSNG